MAAGLPDAFFGARWATSFTIRWQFPQGKPQQQKVAKTLLGYRDQAPDIWRRMRSDPEMRDLSWDERRQIMRTEFDALRDRATKDLEKIVAPADAKALADDSMRDRGRGPTRGPNRTRNR